MDAAHSRPQPPSSSLPHLRRLNEHSFHDIEQALRNLRALYCPLPCISLLRSLQSYNSRKGVLGRLVSEASTPVLDSGYASAVEDEEEEADNADDADVLRSDPIERAFAIRWLTTFIARSEELSPLTDAQDNHEEKVAAVLEEATCVLAVFAEPADDEGDTDGAVTRPFSFPVGTGTSGSVEVTLNDVPLSDEDHTSVGLQSWGASIVLAEQLCADPDRFGLHPRGSTCDELRILELGAGTGLLSLVLGKLFRRPSSAAFTQPKIIATDYHAAVLSNLQYNILTNFPSSASSIDVQMLDWSSPTDAAPLNAPFDILFAADVIYHAEHAAWLRDCAARFLAPGGTFWLIVTLRSTGRHEGVADTVEQVFPCATAARVRTLGILGVEDLEKQRGVGRADEGGYKLYRIGWVS